MSCVTLSWSSSVSIESALGYGLAIALAAFGGPLALLITLVPGVSWILYASDLVDNNIPLEPIKQIPVISSCLVAFAWATAVVFIPLSFAGTTLSPVAAVLFAYTFFSSYISVETLNCRDVADDAKNGVKTLPVLFGVGRTRQILYILNLFVIAVPSIAYIYNVLPLSALVALLFGRVCALALNSLVGRTENYRLLEFLYEMTHVMTAAILFGWFLF